MLLFLSFSVSCITVIRVQHGHPFVHVVVSAGCKFFPQTGSIALFVLIAESFAAPVRATGTAVVLGVGRLGASLAPVVYAPWRTKGSGGGAGR